MKTISTLFLAGFVLILSSGLTVYTRFCEDGCETVISISEEDSKCQMAQEIEVESCCKKEKPVEKSCCSKDKEDKKEDSSDKDDCCHTDRFNLDLDFYGSFQKVEIAPLQFIAIEVPEFEIQWISVLQNELEFTDLPPPDLLQSGRSIILEKASFLI